MKYQLDWLLEKVEQEERVKYLFFWGHQPSKDGSVQATCFSQWWAGHPFEEDGVVYPTAEHYMMAGKAKVFEDQEHWEKIIACETAAEAKKLGRQVRNFEAAVWEEHRCPIVIQGNQLKFEQHEELKTFLLGTKQRVLVEASPRDRIWGIGLGKNSEKAQHPSTWRGLNLLGFCLMEVRDLLQED